MSKVWFITGAGSGIGAGTVRAALRAGDRVVATGRDPYKLRDAYGDLAGVNLAFIKLDVTDEPQVAVAVEEAVAQFGRIDVVVNNAGYSLLGNFEEFTTEQIERQFAPNFWGVVYVMRAVLPVLRQPALRAHHQHLLRRRRGGPSRGGGLRREQVRSRGTLACDREGGRAVRYQDHGG